MAVKTRNIGIQMNQKELTKTFIMISNSKKKSFVHLIIQHFKGLHTHTHSILYSDIGRNDIRQQILAAKSHGKWPNVHSTSHILEKPKGRVYRHSVINLERLT